MKKHRISIYLMETQLKQLRQLSKESGAPVAELIRRAVDEYIAQRKKGGKS